MRKIYFAGSIRGGRGDRERYAMIIGLLRPFGEVLTEHIGDPSLSPSGEEGLTDRAIHDRDLDWLTSSAAVVAEVTVPSLGVGYEIAVALAHGIPVLALYRPEEGRRLSAMIAGAPGVQVAEYGDLAELFPILDKFFDTI